MNGYEKLHVYQNAQETVEAVRGELCEMVHKFFDDCRGSWYYISVDFGKGVCTSCSAPDVINMWVEEVIMGEGEEYSFPVPSSIILQYLNGCTEKAAKEFKKWRNDYWERKRREEKEAEEKQSAEAEYQLYLKLKDKFEK